MKSVTPIASRGSCTTRRIASAHPFWAVVVLGAEEGARDVCLEMKWTTDIDFSPMGTIERMEMAIAEEPDVLVIAAFDPDMMAKTVKRAREKGIPIIAINVEDPAPDQGGLDYLVYIGGDEELGGYTAADQIVKHGVEPKPRGVLQLLPRSRRSPGPAAGASPTA